MATCKARNIDDDTLIRARNDLFVAAQVSGFADKRALPVTRKGTSLTPLSEKLTEDIWYLTDCIFSKRDIKQVMYKSGKRSTRYLEQKLTVKIPQACQLQSALAPSSRVTSHSSEGSTTDNGLSLERVSGGVGERGMIVSGEGEGDGEERGKGEDGIWVSPDRDVRGTCVNISQACQLPPASPASAPASPRVTSHSERSTTDSGDTGILDSISTSIINLHKRLSELENSVTNLHKSLNTIIDMSKKNTDNCHLYVSTNDATCSCAEVSEVIGYPALQVIPLASKSSASASFKVKIERLHLWKALTNDSKEVRIRLWRPTGRLRSTTPSYHIPASSERGCLSLASWNCRGMGQSEPYLNTLAKSADIILIQEHWLWPYELFKLSSYLPEFTSTGKSDHRLTESSTLSRGCGGVGILWRKSLDAGISRWSSASCHMCCIDILLEGLSPDILTIINIYCLSADHSEDEYVQCLQDLEEPVCHANPDTTAS